MRYRFLDKKGHFDPHGNDFPYSYKGGNDNEAIVEAGYRLSKNPADEVYPDGYYLIYRKSDGKLIGRAEKENVEGLQGWKARHWFFGGGQTAGTFRTLRDAALHVLKENAGLSEGWDQ